MEKFFLSGNLKKALSKHKKQVEEQLNIKIEIKQKYIFISAEGDGYSEYVAEKVFKAIDMGFDVDIALTLTNQNFMFDILDIKKGVKPARYKEAVARVIGKRGKTIKNLSKLTGCDIVVHDNLVGVIGESAAVTLAVHALASLIRGAPHSHVYKFLEENKGKIYESEEFE